MTRNDDRVKDEVQAATDIVELISQFIPMKRAGHNFKACCPFHQEKTPSFMVSPSKQIFHCFGCGAGGDVFSFVMRHDNLSFPEALRFLAERAHIQLPEKSFAGNKESQSDQDRLIEVYACASDFYHKMFLQSESGKKAREYFARRGYSLDTAKEFQIGWAAEDWRLLFDYLSKKGFDNNLLVKSTLVQRSPKGHFYDTFRGRLLFPIRNLHGKTVAFGGRLLDSKSEGPKYLNSPEHPIFQKRRELFGLYLAKKSINRERPQLLVVEGYFDWLRLYSSGFKHVVATLGTALTPDHVQVLKRFAEEAVVVYDGDRAGENASLRGLEVFLEGGMNVKLVRMPEGYDPDDWIEKKGAAAFQEILDQSGDFFDFKLQVLLSKFNRWDSLGLIKITNEFLDTLVKVKNTVLLDRYLRKLAGALGIEENSLRLELQKLSKKMAGQSGAQVPKSPSKAEGFEAMSHSDEWMALYLAMENSRFAEKVFSELHVADFADYSCGRVFQILENEYQQSKKIMWPQILQRFQDEKIKEKLVGLSALEMTSEEKEKSFQDCLKRIKQRKLDGHLSALRREIAKAELEKNREKLDFFLKQYRELLQNPNAAHETM